MRRLFICLLVLAFVVLIAGASMAEEKEQIPNLVGHWHGKSMMHFAKEGFKKGAEPLKWVVEKQDGRVFSGKKIWISNGTEMTENFSGVIAMDNKRIFVAEHTDGHVFGDIMSKDKMVIYYSEDGENAKVIITELDKQKK